MVHLSVFPALGKVNVDKVNKVQLKKIEEVVVANGWKLYKNDMTKSCYTIINPKVLPVDQGPDVAFKIEKTIKEALNI